MVPCETHYPVEFLRWLKLSCLCAMMLTSGVTASSVALWTTQVPLASHGPAGRGCLAGLDRAIHPGPVLPARISMIVSR